MYHIIIRKTKYINPTTIHKTEDNENYKLIKQENEL